MIYNDTTAHHCYGYAFSFIAISQDVDSNYVKCLFNSVAKRKKILLLTMIEGFNVTCFMTVLHKCASQKVRQLVIQDFGSVFFKKRRITKALV